MKKTNWVKLATVGILLYQTVLPFTQVAQANEEPPPTTQPAINDVIKPLTLDVEAQNEEETTAADFEFDENTGTITGLKNDAKSKGHLIIPSKINGKAVKAIANEAFHNKGVLATKLSFEKNDDLSDLGNSTFRDTKLVEIDINNLDNLYSIGESTFRDCSELTQVNFGNRLGSLWEIGNYTFLNTKLVELDFSTLSGLNNIGNYTFYGCSDLTKANFGTRSIRSIGLYTFSGTALKELDLSNLTYLYEIGHYTFGNTNLVKVDLSGLSSLDSIGNSTFLGTQDLKTIYAGNELSKIRGLLNTNKSGLDNSVFIAGNQKSIDFYVRSLDDGNFPADPLKSEELTGCTVGDLNTTIYRLEQPEIVVPNDLALEWRESENLQDATVKLTSPSTTPFADSYYGSYTFSDPASLTINPAKTEALYDGKEHGLTKEDIYLKDYPDYTLPITKIEYQLENGGFSETPPKAEGTYQVQVTVSGQPAPIILTDTIVINPVAKYTVNFETRGNGDLVGKSTATVEENELIQGDQVPTPKADKGHIFSKWVDEAGNTVDNITEIAITKDRTFTAVFKAVPEDVKLAVLHRLYNPNSGEHFYTLDPDEKDNLVKHGWDYEGITGSQPTNKGEAVYRMYNPNEGGEHHYTPLKEEVEFLKKAGWNYEGVAFRTGGNKKVHRLYNENAVTGTHHYTQLDSELSWLKGLGWSHEGTGWYSY